MTSLKCNDNKFKEVTFIYIYEHMYASTGELLLKDSPNKGYSTFDLSIKDKFVVPTESCQYNFNVSYFSNVLILVILVSDPRTNKFNMP